MNQQDELDTYSVVVPVYNSAPLVGETIKRVAAFFKGRGWPYELILVNDGSSDRSWDVLRENARANPHIVAINLLRNYGQHTAVYCGLRESAGDYVITLDDDLQNPPEEIAHLVIKAREGHDAVFGRYRQKRHSWPRRLGSALISEVNRHIFHQPRDLVLTNFRVLRRDVVDRICAYRTRYPYINGLAVMFSVNPANVLVEHRERLLGQSQYDFLKIVKLVMRILFNYSAWPLRLVSTLGMAIAGASFLLGLYFVGRRLFGDVQVPGWTTVVVLLSFFNGISLLVSSMLGEYVVRLLNETSSSQSYYVKEVIGRRG